MSASQPATEPCAGWAGQPTINRISKKHGLSPDSFGPLIDHLLEDDGGPEPAGISGEE